MRKADNLEDKENINTTNFRVPSERKNNKLLNNCHKVILNEDFSANESRTLNKKESEIMKCNSSPSKEDDQGILLIKKSQIISQESENLSQSNLTINFLHYLNPDSEDNLKLNDGDSHSSNDEESKDQKFPREFQDNENLDSRSIQFLKDEDSNQNQCEYN